MPISNKSLFAGCMIAAALSAHADELTLAGGDSRLTGTLRSIQEDGVVELLSDLSPEPLMLRDGMVRKVTFSLDPPAGELTSATVELKNGDRLPVAIESLDERMLVVESPQAGRLEIARDAIKSMQLGLSRNKVIYAGPVKLEDWSHAVEDMAHWSFERDSLVSRGPSTASRMFELPEQFILRFNLSWQNRSTPNIQVFFADPLKEKGVAVDRYYLQFSGAGLEIKREAANGKRYTTVGLLNRTPNQYPENKIKVEIRVIRQTSRLQLFINDEPEGEFVDATPAVPVGSGITFFCNTQNGFTQEISAIEVLEFDDKRGRHGTEERGDPKSDSLITRDEDRWSGSLHSISGGESGALFRFKSDFQEGLMEIPEADVSTVFFADQAVKPADKTAAKARQPYLLHLRGGGLLRVSSCVFNAESVTAVHPLLGQLELRRDGVEAMERAQSKSEKKSEP